MQGAIDELYACASDYAAYNNRLTSVEDYKNQIYPIGSIYISVTNTNPETLFGGTWVAFGQGRTLLGVGSIEANNVTVHGTVTAGEINSTNAGNMGGEAKHTLTIAEMPSHTHAATHPDVIYAYRSQLNATNQSTTFLNIPSLSTITQSGYLGSDRLTDANIVNKTGSSNSHNIIQPYITVYMWKRTA